MSPQVDPLVTQGVTPDPGDILRVDHRASVQFVEMIRFRVIRCLPWTTWQGYIWLDGYQLGHCGTDAIERRSIYVQLDGLCWERREKDARTAAAA